MGQVIQLSLPNFDMPAIPEREYHVQSHVYRSEYGENRHSNENVPKVFVFSDWSRTIPDESDDDEDLVDLVSHRLRQHEEVTYYREALLTP